MNLFNITKLTVGLAVICTGSISAFAGTSLHCQNTPRNNCSQNSDCTEAVASSSYYCKQICTPYIDAGCCYYFKELVTFTGANCPCLGPVYTRITLANNLTSSQCKPTFDGTPADCSFELDGGSCY